MGRITKLAVLYAGFFLIGVVSAHAAPITAISHITAVTVYSDRATITREAEIDIPAGPSTVVLEGLPTSLMANSLRAEGKAETNVTLGALDNKIVNTEELTGEKERALNAQLQQVRDQLSVLAAEGSANDARATFLQKVGEAADDAVNNNFVHMDLKPEQWSAGSTVLFNSLSETLKAGVTMQIAERKLSDQITALEATLSQLRTGARSSTRVSVPLDSPQATKLILRVSYQLLNATWRPVYDARVDTKTSKLSLTEFGEVHQTTGEDWNNIALTLSTAEPAVGASPPHITPELVDFETVGLQDYGRAVEEANKQKIANEGAAGKSVIMNESLAAFSPPPVAPPAAASFQTASIETGGFVSEYKIPGQANVTADNTASKVMIGTVDNTATLFEQVRPALSAHAFLIARVKIAGDAPLLPGEASLFRDGVFIGSETLPLLRPGEESRVSMGIDDQVAVKQQTIADTQGTSGVLNKYKTHEVKVLTSVHNLHKTPIDLEVLEAVPVPRNEDIKLEILADDTTQGYATDFENVTGINLWKSTIKPGDTTDIKLGWRLTWPAGREVSGISTGTFGSVNRL